MTGARCLVFGGTGTLGREVCAALAARNARVVFTYHAQEDAAARLAAGLPGGLALRLDAASVADVDRVAGAAADALGGLEAFVHCAGVGVTVAHDGPTAHHRMADVNEEAWDRMLDVNVRSAFFAVRRVSVAMRGNGGGNVVLTGSIDGVKPVPAPVHYAASKGALGGMAQAMAKELGPDGIRVNVVAPGILDGGMSSVLPEDLRREYLKHCGLKRFGRPAEVAALIAWLAVENTYVTGRTILVDGAL